MCGVKTLVISAILLWRCTDVRLPEVLGYGWMASWQSETPVRTPASEF
jgi:hypothetical protein